MFLAAPPITKCALLHIVEWKGGWWTLLSHPTRWSLVLIFGFLSWSYFPIQITEGCAECTSNHIYSERLCHPPSTDPPTMLMHWCCWCADADAAIQQIIFAVPKSIWGAELDLQEAAVVSNQFDHLKLIRLEVSVIHFRKNQGKWDNTGICSLKVGVLYSQKQMSE